MYNNTRINRHVARHACSFSVPCVPSSPACKGRCDAAGGFCLGYSPLPPFEQGERTPCERMCRAVTRDGAVMVSTDLQRSVRVCDAAWVTAGAVVRVSQGAKLAVFKIAVLVLGLEVVL
jgi:hypothetical protein